MKIDSETVSKVERYEYKRGIKYAKVDGKLFNSLKVLYTITFAYNNLINLLFILGWLLMSGTESFKYITESLYIIIGCTVINVIGFIFICTKIKIAGIITSIIPLGFSLLTFARLLEDATIRFGYKISFYWRHLAPITLMSFFLIFMLIIIIREKVKFKSTLKKIEEIIYNETVNITED